MSSNLKFLLLVVLIAALALAPATENSGFSKATQDSQSTVEAALETAVVSRAYEPTPEQLAEHYRTARPATPITDCKITLNDEEVDIGDISVSLSLVPLMTTTFTMAPEYEYLCDSCGVSFHWVQLIPADACPAKYAGNPLPMPHVDPPLEGWDYMYTDSSTRGNPNNSIPNYGWFIDSDPWYYNSVGEATRNTICKTYVAKDKPGPCTVPVNGVTSFKTWLVMQIGPTKFCLIAGFSWSISTAGNTGPTNLGAPTAAHATEVSSALTNGKIIGWAVDDKCKIVCGKSHYATTDPGTAKPPTTPWMRVGIDGVPIPTAAGGKVWVSKRNEYRKTKQKSWTVTVKGSAADKVEVSDQYGYDNQTPPKKVPFAKHIKPPKDAVGPPKTRTFSFLFKPQPEWEVAVLKRTSKDGTTENVDVETESKCTTMKLVEMQVILDSSWFGFPEVEYLDIIEVELYPETVPVDMEGIHTFTAPGTWIPWIVFEDPDGEPRPQGGVRWTLEGGGPGLDAGDIYSLTMEMLDSADYAYSMYAFDAITDEYKFFRIVNVLPPALQIEKTHNTLQGHYEFVSITLEDYELEMGGFDFLIAYDASALTFMEATPGQLLEDCGWEYFTYRYGVQGNCGDACPSGLLRIIAIADMNNGPNHPSCYGPPDTDPHELAEMKFYITNDRAFECQYVPIYFFWGDCGDNAISSVDGNILYIDHAIYDFEGNLIWDEEDDDEFPEDERIPFVGAPNFCLEGDKTVPIRFLNFWNGGIDIVCADSIDRNGDLNLNNIPNEIADAVVYTNYFLFGPTAFHINYEAQVAASEVNNDGMPLTVGDLIYLIRIITGDALPYSKLSPFAQNASVNMLVNHSAVAVSTNSAADLGAGYFVIEHSGYEIGEPYLINGASDMTLKYNDEDGVLKVLVYSMEKGRKIIAGRENIFVIPITGDGSIDLTEIQMSDYYGNLLSSNIEKQPTLPKTFALHQNYPNPFNAATQISFELPKQVHLKIEIFNVIGQKVVTLFDGEQTAGVHSIEWNGADQSGRNVASGIYLYRLTAENFKSERKMVLLK